MKCVFCGIAAGELPASLVHQDDDVIAFLDLHPVRPGHLLVVPRAHGQHLASLAPAVRGRMWEVGHELATALRAAALADDVHLVLNDGPHAFQSVAHAHLHVIPRVRGDGLRFVARLLTLPLARLRPADRSSLDALAARIRG